LDDAMPLDGSRPLALITGASAGIGAAFARELASRGYDLIVVARRVERLEELAASLSTNVRVVASDLSTDEGLAEVERVVEESRIALLINNAGLGAFGPVAAQDPVALSATVVVNALAPVRLTRSALPGMLEAGAGGVIAVSSPAAVPLPRLAAYAATKSFVDVFFESVRREVADQGIRVTVVVPGYTHTEWHEKAGVDVSGVPARVWLDPSQVARAALDAWSEGKARIAVRPLEDRTRLSEAVGFVCRRVPRQVREAAFVRRLRTVGRRR